MSQTLPQVTRAHGDTLAAHIDRMPALGDDLLGASAAGVASALADLQAFLDGTLAPHLDATEETIYPELERMFQNRHSMAPMRREHADIRRLSGALREASARMATSGPTLGSILATRRVVFSLYALLKVHLAEEDAYVRLLDRGVTEDVADLLAAALEHPVAR